MFAQCCNYASMDWIENVYYVKVNLYSIYVNEISIKCLKKYLLQSLIKCYRRYFIGYNYMFNAPPREEWLICNHE